MRILICGAGALGSSLTRLLVPDLRGQHELTVLDKDKVEERNVTPGTQFYTPDQLSLPKVEALQYNIWKSFNREIGILHQELEDTDKSIFMAPVDEEEKYSLLVDCFDNHDSRKLLQSFSDVFPVLHIGFSDSYTFAIEWADNYQVPTDIKSGFDICEMAGAAAFVNMVAALGALTIEEFIWNNKRLEFVGNKFNMREIL